MNDVAIIGVGLHPFGRFGQDRRCRWVPKRSNRALTDAGVGWKDIQFGFGGSHEVSNPDAVTRLVGLTGIPFTNVFNACATAASAIQQTADTIRLGKYDIGIAIGMDKHPRGAFTDDPAKLGAAALVRRERAVHHHQVLRHEGQQVPPRPRHLPGDAGQGGGQELPQRRAQPECLPAQADVRGGDPRLADAELPADAVHVLRARRRRRGRGHVPRRHRAPLHRQAGVRAGHRDPHPPLRRLRGARHVGAGGRGRLADGLRGQGRLRGGRDRARGRRRRPAAGHRRRRRGHPHGRDGFCAPTASRRSWWPTAPPRSTGRSRSTPTAG